MSAPQVEFANSQRKSDHLTHRRSKAELGLPYVMNQFFDNLEKVWYKELY